MILKKRCYLTKKETEVLLITASIDGYNAQSLSAGQSPYHARAIISVLMKNFLNDSMRPLRLLSASGDRACMYAVSRSWKKDREKIKSRLSAAFIKFRRDALKLSASSPCKCGACAAARDLRLKIVIHAGRAAVSKSGNSVVLSGRDVRLSRCLVNNSVRSNEYILMTDQAMHSLGYRDASKFFRGSENYPGMGEIKTYILLPGPEIGEILKNFTPGSLDTPLNRIKTAGLIFESMVRLNSAGEKP
ncbi:MAG: DUF2652 domain-containing protein [Spirochaetia bacterium]|nr:DUF2652 domain-containing protein [Spirochaetia bacterium]